ncbi:hypothetical protein JCM8097_003260 [Rhodosporidiobolus ruineniae]
MTAGDPNFPVNLAITASRRKKEAGGGGTGSDEEDAWQDVAGFGIAGRTWEAAYLLRQYLTPPSSTSAPPIFDPPCPLYPPTVSAPIPSSNARLPAPSSAPRPPRTILELGSGSGFLSLSLAPHLAPTDTLVLTDLDNVCPLLAKNLETARRRWAKKGVFQSPHPPSHDGKPAPSTALEPTVLVRPLPWGSTSALAALRAATLGYPDIILASDLIYFEFLYAPLLRTLIGLTEPRPSGDVSEGEGQGGETGPIVLFSYKIRSLVKEQPFWEAFGRWFRFEAVQLGTPLPPPSPPSPPSSPPIPSPTSSAPSAPSKLLWSRFGAATPSSLTNPNAAPGETDELYVFLCRRWPKTLGVGQAVLAEGEDGVRDEDLLLGRGKARGFEEGAGQFEEMLLLGQEWDW